MDQRNLTLNMFPITNTNQMLHLSSSYPQDVNSRSSEAVLYCTTGVVVVAFLWNRDIGSIAPDPRRNATIHKE